MPISIYTDGSCHGNPGPGGYAAVIVNPDGTHREIVGGDPATTNNRMEMIAAIVALEAFPHGTELRIVSDSRYLVDGMNEWLDDWKARGWKTSKKKTPENLDLWRRLNSLAMRRKVEWEWIRAHNGDQFNELADRLANEAAKGAALGVA
jgi:ribonuclease HI